MSHDSRTALERRTPSLDVPTHGREAGASDTIAEGLAAGTLLAGRYRVLEHLGAGGMGAVYRARDLTLDADIALKLLPPARTADPEALAWFRAEVRVARLVTHPNVCRLHDLEDGDDGCFITMEYVEGESLSARLRAGELALPDARAILRDVAAGLAAAHAAGVVHRDLKPSNVLLARDGRAVVADFGIAAEHHDLASGAPHVAGTLGYMAPEQARGERIDARADVYAFGVLALVATTGTRPPPNLTSTAEAPDHGGSAAALPVSDIAAAVATLPPALARLIERCLAPDPADRPADGAAIVAALATPARAITDAADTATLRTTARGARGRWLVALALPAIALVVVAIALVRGRHAPAAAHGARVFVAPADVSALAPDERWLGPVIDRLVVDELVDGWAIDADVSGSGAGATLTRDPTGRLQLAVDGETLEATTPRDLALLAGAAIARAEVPADERRPNADDLHAAGAHDAEAWRWWRRAMRESMMQRWERVDLLCAQARAIDPSFAMADLEASMVFDADDPAGIAAVDKALGEVDRADVAPVWRMLARVLRALRAGDQAAAGRAVAELRAMSLDPHDRLYLEVRAAISAYETDPRAAALPVSALAEKYPRDGAAPKLAAAIYLDSDEPGAAATALRYADAALALAPDDTGVRALDGIALVRAGRTEDARARARELSALPPDDRRLARSRLFELHMALADLPEADADARREQTGSPTEKAGGLAEAGLLHLRWGQLAAGYDALEAGATAFDTAGLARSAAQARYRLGMAAWAAGDRPRALAAFTAMAARPSEFAPGAAVLAKIVGGDLATAHALAGKLADGTPARLLVEVELAAAERRDEAVIALSDRLALASTSLAVMLARADAFERLGRRDAAMAALGQLARDPLAYTFPVAVTLAWARLGELRVAAHDDAGAREAFGEVARRWERAPLRPEVVRAKRYLDGR